MNADSTTLYSVYRFRRVQVLVSRTYDDLTGHFDVFLFALRLGVEEAGFMCKADVKHDEAWIFAWFITTPTQNPLVPVAFSGPWNIVNGAYTGYAFNSNANAIEGAKATPLLIYPVPYI